MKLAESARQAGYRLNSFDSLGSTNDEAMARGMAGDRGGLWVVAGSQGEGRGRQGRAWVSPPGNLYASLLLVDVVEPVRSAQLSVVAGVALAEAVSLVTGRADAIAIKWPNDILADGAKLGGILVEGAQTTSGVFAVVAGFGVNCVSHPIGLAYKTTDLSTAAGVAVGPARLFETLSDRMAATVAAWDGGRGFASIRERWLERTMPVGTRLSVDIRGDRVEGAFATMDATGRLVLATKNGPVTVEAGDVMIVGRRAAIG